MLYKRRTRSCRSIFARLLEKQVVVVYIIGTGVHHMWTVASYVVLDAPHRNEYTSKPSKSRYIICTLLIAICGNKMPTRRNRGFYCRSHCLLNMFRAPLCPLSGAQEYYTVVADCGISCCGFQVAGLVWS